MNRAVGTKRHTVYATCLLYIHGSSTAIQTLVEVLRIEMALKLNNSDAGGGIHNKFFHESSQKKT